MKITIEHHCGRLRLNPDVTWNEDCPHPPAPSPREERGSKIQKTLVPLSQRERG